MAAAAFCRYHRLMPQPRRFPSPWVVEERAESFTVHDANGQALGYFYFDDEPKRRARPQRWSSRSANT